MTNFQLKFLIYGLFALTIIKVQAAAENVPFVDLTQPINCQRMDELSTASKIDSLTQQLAQLQTEIAQLKANQLQQSHQETAETAAQQPEELVATSRSSPSLAEKIARETKRVIDQATERVPVETERIINQAAERVPVEAKRVKEQINKGWKKLIGKK